MTEIVPRDDDAIEFGTELFKSHAFYSGIPLSRCSVVVGVTRRGKMRNLMVINTTNILDDDYDQDTEYTQYFYDAAEVGERKIMVKV